ncbi:hypothetical protein F383_14885 [Gossypium arboreum]|uniref:Uncharacterized protein n=1 Tax=Gossypium arboreum TaxID=29729 RepID=A0A0B0MBY1_GOSAR|nr:hypothetical protein F383_14885 [Gossypium arboreum]
MPHSFTSKTKNRYLLIFKGNPRFIIIID